MRKTLLSLSVFFTGLISFGQATYTFTPAGATGTTGPTQVMLDAEYAGTNLDGMVVGAGGIQKWEVPVSGNYSIEAFGGQGYGAFGGRGAHIYGEFFLTAGDTLKILVGQQAGHYLNYPSTTYNHQFGGGGGSFVTQLDNTPLVVAGGGGGNHGTSFIASCDGQITEAGASGANGSLIGAGGTGGNGGLQANQADGGAGLLGNGDGVAGGIAFVNGGLGGIDEGTGGFGGGGGCSSWNNYRGGGGGGYSGGGGGTNGTSCCPAGGGGGSYNAGTNPTNLAGIQLGDGMVVISALCAPTTITPDAATLTDATGECSITPTAPTASNDCGSTFTGTPDLTFPITTPGTTVVTWTYDDGFNQTTQTQNVVLADITAPTADLATLPDLNDQCTATPTPPTATDNCDGMITATADVTFPVTAPGTTVVTWTYTDNAGNTSTQTQNIINPTIDVTVNENGGQLQANQLVSSYQWLDCDNSFAEINGAVNQFFDPVTTGNYAVEITSSAGCIDTSACYLVDLTAIDELMLPTDKEIVGIYDLTGRRTEFRPNTPLIIVYKDGTRQRIFKMRE